MADMRHLSVNRKTRRMLYVGRVKMFAACFVACLVSSHAQFIKTDDIKDMLNGPVLVTSPPSPSRTRVELPDATAIAGRLFSYRIPDGIVGNDAGKQFKIVEAGKDSLPQWLHLVAEQNTLQGVPSPSDLGQLYLQLQGHQEKTIDPMFSIKVMDDLKDTAATTAKKLEELTNKMKRPRCLQGAALTMATVIVDSDLNKMAAIDRVDLLRALHHHLNIDEDLLKLLPVGSSGMFDSSALVAGPGNIKEAKHGGVTVQWMVGCGSVETHNLNILQKVESTSADGSMAKAIGHGVIGWHVTNNRPERKVRLRRQAVKPTPLLGTPVPSSGAPTKLTGITVVIEPTVSPTATESPMTRSVPAMESPSFPVRMSPTTVHHQHRTKKKKVPTATLS